MKIPIDKTILTPDVERVCLTGLLAGDAFESCIQIEVTDARSRSKKQKSRNGKSHRARGHEPDHPR